MGKKAMIGGRRTLTVAALMLSLAGGALWGQAAERGAAGGGAEYAYGFSPGRGALRVVEDSIATARRSILIACYEFTSREIADALIQAARSGIRVAVVADERASEEPYSRVPYLARAGISVRLDGRYRIMHDKFMVIDGRDVETGSFNYTEAAVQDNAENAILLVDVPAIAAGFTRDWWRLWNESAALGR